MDSTSLWSMPRREHRSPQVPVVPDNMESTGLTPTPTNAEPVENTSPDISSKSPIANLGAVGKSQLSVHPTTCAYSTALSNPPSSVGRPCLAGTQTVRHQIGLQNTPPQTITDLINTSALSEYTHESSGFGSLMHDRSSASIVSGYSRSTDRSAAHCGWHLRNLGPLEGDTSDIGLDQSCMQDSACQLESPIRRTEYQDVSAAATMDSTGRPIRSPFSAGMSRLDESVDQEALMFEDNMDAGQQTVSGRQSRMLEENLASVARYVEELTGCGARTGMNNSLNPIKSDLTHPLASPSPPPSLHTSQHQQKKQEQGPPQQVLKPTSPMNEEQRLRKYIPAEEVAQPVQSLGLMSSGSQSSNVTSQVSHLEQLQYLNQQLSALASTSVSPTTSTMNKCTERETLNTAAQELLRRLLTNQLPGLIENAIRETKPDSAEWSAGSEGIHTKTQLQALQQKEQEHQSSGTNAPLVYGTSSVSACASGSTSGQGVSPLLTNTMRTTNTTNQTRDHCGNARSASGNLRSVQELSAPGACQQMSALDPVLVANVLTQLGLLVSPQTPTVNNATASNGTVALLANLLGSGQSYLSNTNQRSDPISTSALATLLFSLQAPREQTAGPRPLLSRDSQRRPANLVNRQTEVVGTGLMSDLVSHHTVPRPLNNLMDELQRLTVPYHQLLASMEPDIERAANVYRNSASSVAQKSEAAYHWSGKLPVRVYRSMTFSRKVFLGGVPWDSTSEDLMMVFSRFGNVTISWPQKDGSPYHQGHIKRPTPKGYCYLIFEHESSVTDLLAACVRDPGNGGDYYRISGPEFKSKNVQVIPWVISDSQYTKSGPYRPDTKRTVFIGALHGMITAEALVTIMNDLFGNVVFAALDTDRYKYPIGSGRVAFSSHKSYMRAVTANFVDVRTSKFTKTIQIDPYLEDAYCDSCYTNPGIYFCRAFDCFRYFCPACWQLWHNSTETLLTHKPLRRAFKPFSDTHWTNPIKY
ncbi:hypothetical protein D915_006652 [Fasciola hepatica]|uniref:RRM domain-containing protein n=1 Tax=Fasciola hepatica TaxID=6192 RepID=A0A4E0RMR3_FASHE|nr:hypothetical protein D915_006652 [Fasciola hepatica]